MTCNWCGKDVPDGQGAGAGSAACRNNGMVSIEGHYHMKCIHEALAKFVELNGGRPNHNLEQFLKEDELWRKKHE